MWAELIKQAPAAAAVVFVVVAFLRYLTVLNAKQEAADKQRAEREERLEAQRALVLKDMADSCHENHRTLAAESRAAIIGLQNSLAENTRVMGANTEALRKKAS